MNFRNISAWCIRNPIPSVLLFLMLSLGGAFEFYDLFLMGYIGPGLVRSGLFSAGSATLPTAARTPAEEAIRAQRCSS